MTFEKDRNGVSTYRRRRVVGIWLALLLSVVALTLCNSALAQRTTGSLRGQVLDPQGAAVANARARIAPLIASALRKQSLAKEFIKNRAKNPLAYIVRWQAKSTSEHCLYRIAR